MTLSIAGGAVNGGTKRSMAVALTPIARRMMMNKNLLFVNDDAKCKRCIGAHTCYLLKALLDKIHEIHTMPCVKEVQELKDDNTFLYNVYAIGGFLECPEFIEVPHD